MPTMFKVKPFRSPKYLKWVASQGCCICGKQAVAHHVETGGKGTKCPDNICVGLCDPFGHHSELHRIGKKSFAEKYNVDLRAIADRLFSKWSKEE